MMNIQEMNQAFESNFKKTETYRRECKIRGKDVLEFSETMQAYFNIVVNEAWTMWQQAIKNAVPDWAVIAPRLSANYLYSKVPELGFKSQDEKETVLYHLNYMASEFKEDAKKFVIDDHEKQKAMIQEETAAVLFPKEPTKELYTAFHEAFSAAGTGRTVDNFRAGYGAMVAFIHGNEGQ